MPLAADSNTLTLTSQNPWPGLVSFQESNRAFFFGREREVGDLARVVSQEPLTLLFGKSGLGKTSLLQAGLGPVLRELEFLPIFIRLDHNDNALPLEVQVEDRIVEVLEHEHVEAPRPIHEETLWEYFHKRGCDWWDSENRLLKPVLIFDQFEELLTAGQENPARAARTNAFLVELEDLVENRPPAALQKRFESERGLARNYDFERMNYRVVIALREDYLADLESLHDRFRSVMRNRFRLMPMTGGQALDVVLKPGAELVDEHVACKIVDFVSSSERFESEAVVRTDIADRQTEPALLSVVLQELNNRRIQKRQAKITADLLGDGRATEILQDFYERALAGMGPAVHEFLMDSLLTSSGARNRIAEEDALTKPGITPDILSDLIDRRIIQRQLTGRLKWLELTHDRLAGVVRAEREVYRKKREVAIAERQAQLAREALARTRKLVSAFAVLLILAMAGLAYAFVKASELRASYRDLDREKRRAETMNSQLVVQGADLSKTHTNLQRRAEIEAEQIVSEFEKMLDEIVPGAAALVKRELGELAADAQEFDSVALRRSRAYADALGANILLDEGFISEGLDAARRSLDSVTDMKARGVASDSLAAVEMNGQYAMGLGLRDVGKLDEAESCLRAASSFAERLRSTRIQVLSQLRLARNQDDRGLSQRAGEIYDRVIQQLNGKQDEQSAYWRALLTENTAMVQSTPLAARARLASARDIAEGMIHRHPESLRWRRIASEIGRNEIYHMTDAANWTETSARVQAATENAEVVYNADVENLNSRLEMAITFRMRGMFYFKVGDAENARSEFTRMKADASLVRQAQPRWLSARRQLAVSDYYLATVEARPALKAKLLEEGVALTDEYVRDAPADADGNQDGSLFYTQLGILADGQQGKREESAKWFNGSLALLLKVRPEVLATPDMQTRLGDAYLNKGFYVSNRANRYAAAEADYEESIRAHRKALGSPTPERYSNLANVYRWLGINEIQSGQKDRAVQSFLKAQETYETAAKKFPNDPALIESQARVYLAIAQQWRLAGDLAAVVANLNHAMEMGKRLLDQDPVQFGIYEFMQEIGKEVAPAQDLLQKQPKTAVASLSAQLEALHEAATEEALSKVIIHEGNWNLPPLIPGNWRTLRKKEQVALGGLPLASKDTRAKVLRVRALPIGFYPDATLYEAEVERENGATAVLDFVRSRDAELVLTGVSPPIHEFNKKAPLQIANSRQALDYLRFFTAAIQAEDGIFRIVDSEQEVAPSLDVDADDAARAEIRKSVIPLQVRETTDGKWDVIATVQYSRSISRVFFQVPRTGVVKMQIDNSVASDLPLLVEQYSDGLRVLESDPIATQTTRAKSLAQRRIWKEAVDTESKVVELIRKTIGDNRNQRLAIGLNSLCWYQLHAKNFTGALANCREALSLNPSESDKNLIQTNLAHALLLTGQVDQAAALYRANVGKSVNNTMWEAAVLADFDSLNKEGITHPEMDRFRQFVRDRR